MKADVSREIGSYPQHQNRPALKKTPFPPKFCHSLGPKPSGFNPIWPERSGEKTHPRQASMQARGNLPPIESFVIRQIRQHCGTI